MENPVDRTNEYIWAHDFKDRNLGNLVLKLFEELRTYGELAALSDIALKEAGFDDNQQSDIRNMLLIRGFTRLTQNR